MMTLYAVIAGIGIVITMLVTALARAVKAGKDEVKAEEGKKNEKLIEIIADANSAGRRSRSSKLRDDDGFKRD